MCSVSLFCNFGTVNPVSAVCVLFRLFEWDSSKEFLERNYFTWLIENKITCNPELICGTLKGPVIQTVSNPGENKYGSRRKILKKLDINFFSVPFSCCHIWFLLDWKRSVVIHCSIIAKAKRMNGAIEGEKGGFKIMKGHKIERWTNVCYV